MTPERELATHFARSHPSETGRVLEGIEADVALCVINDFEADVAYGVLAAMAPHRAAAFLSRLTFEHVVELVRAAPAVHAVWLLRRLEDQRQTSVLEALEPKRAKAMKRILTAREDTAGAFVSPDVFALPVEFTVHDVLEQYGEELVAASDAVPVVDADHRLAGMVRLHDLRRSPRQTPIRTIMDSAAPVVRAHLERRGIVGHPGWQHASTLPVVDDHGVLLGMLDYQDYRSIEKDLRRGPLAPVESTSRALGSLYGIAVGGLLETLVLLSEGGSSE